MSTSDSREAASTSRPTPRRCQHQDGRASVGGMRGVAGLLAAAVGCVAFNLVYVQFSHGVSSPFMTFAFVCPLAGAVVLAVLRFGAGYGHGRGRQFCNAFYCGIATLAVGCILQGVFAIAGTASAFQPVFYLAGAVLLALAAFFEVRPKGA